MTTTRTLQVFFLPVLLLLAACAQKGDLFEGQQAAYQASQAKSPASSSATGSGSYVSASASTYYPESYGSGVDQDGSALNAEMNLTEGGLAAHCTVIAERENGKVYGFCTDGPPLVVCPVVVSISSEETQYGHCVYIATGAPASPQDPIFNGGVRPPGTIYIGD